ncbi:site-specific integrase [Limibaculum sp. FT325]|uniref:tyrosine-type recombinase/integrase n=1 Tax=Thermohalobaculum sediminis TaxID=2939436 RepID=UPI0020BDA3DA|nr:site-specific integrase [Limibaculum sediminis]MCL5779211.1 site-specific integrase [Limibaculum sediminis]
MNTRLTERTVKAAGIGSRKYVIFDEDCSGFGLCVYESGRKGFVLIYRIAGRQRRFTIGGWPAWSVTAAREEAKRLKREIDRGDDPLDGRKSSREAPTVKDLAERFIAEHLPKLEATNARDQISMLEKLVLPEWRNQKVADITPHDVDKLLSKIAEGRTRPAKRQPKAKRRTPLKPAKPTPVRANRVGEALRKMFNLAVQWRMRSDNPALGFRKRPETARERFLSFDEINRLADALARDEDQRAAGIIRLCMLTGARLGEVRTATFDQFNLDLAIWTKQAAYTKQRRTHRIPISPEAVALVRLRREAVPPGCLFLFPGDVEGQPVQELKRFWARMRENAEIPDVRIHDLRHTFASLLVSGGASLEMIGKLLGHTQIGTTQSYAHLIESPLRAGVNAVGEMLRPRLKVVGE